MAPHAGSPYRGPSIGERADKNSLLRVQRLVLGL